MLSLTYTISFLVIALAILIVKFPYMTECLISAQVVSLPSPCSWLETLGSVAPVCRIAMYLFQTVMPFAMPDHGHPSIV